jgi:RNA polymerase sigma-70 factor (ECF subfamily)
MNLHNTSDVFPLIEDCLKGSRRAQNKLYEVGFPYAMSVALRYARNRDEGLEIVNEAFARVFNYLDKFDPTNSFAFWLRKIVINTAIDRYHVNVHEYSHLVSIDDEHFIEPDTDDYPEEFTSEELFKQIQSLPPIYRLVFSLFAIEGFSHREISAQLGISEGTSKSNYFKAKKKLKAQLIRLGYSKKYMKS